MEKRKINKKLKKLFTFPQRCDIIFTGGDNNPTIKNRGK